MKLVNDPVITEYVNRVGQNLVRNSDAQVPFTIKVIDSDVVNAMASARRILLRELRTDSGRGRRSRDGRRHGARDRPRGGLPLRPRNDARQPAPDGLDPVHLHGRRARIRHLRRHGTWRFP